MMMREPKKMLVMVLVVYILASTIYMFDTISSQRQQGTAAITGMATGQVAINIVSQCRITFVTDFNHISICTNLTNSSISNVLSSIDGKYSFILRWNRSRQAFDTYSPEAASNSFQNFKLNESYFVYITQGAQINIQGEGVSSMNISLQKEFNAPSYPYRTATNITEYIGPIQQNISFMLRWNKTTQRFMVFSPEAAVNEITRINKAEGQFIFLTANSGKLHYNRSSLGP